MKKTMWGTGSQYIKFSFDVIPNKTVHIDFGDFDGMELDFIYDVLTKASVSYDRDEILPNDDEYVEYQNYTFDGDYEAGKTYSIIYNLKVFLENVSITYENLYNDPYETDCWVEGSYIVAIDTEKLTEILNKYYGNQFVINNVSVDYIGDVTEKDVKVDEDYYYGDV